MSLLLGGNNLEEYIDIISGDAEVYGDIKILGNDLYEQSGNTASLFLGDTTNSLTATKGSNLIVKYKTDMIFKTGTTETLKLDSNGNSLFAGKLSTQSVNIEDIIYINNETFLMDNKPSGTATVIDYNTYNNYSVISTQSVSIPIIEYTRLNKMNIVYFPDNDDTYDFTTLPAHKLTHIIMGFGFGNWTQSQYDTAITAGLSYNGDYDNTVAEGILAFRYTTKFNNNLAKLKGIKSKYPHIKICISLGGGKMSWNFSAVLSTQTTRDNFVNSIVGYIVREKLDGINIDWEYPRFAAHTYSLFNLDNDLNNYVLFLTELRTLLDKCSPDKYIPISVASGNYEGVINDFVGMNALIDYYYIMTYDYSGTTWNEANPQTPLEDTGMNDNKYARKSAELMNTVSKIPMDKICIGAASYGWGWGIVDMTGTTGFYGDVDDPDNPTLADDFSGGTATGVEFYKNIVNERDTNVDYIEVYDTYNSITFGVHLEKDNLDGTHEIWTYDNQQTVGAKAQYIKDDNLAGIINWNLTGDTTDNSTSLIHAAYSKFIEKNNFNVSVLANNINKLTINKQGWLGLGIDNPSAKLDVEGDGKFSNDLGVSGDFYLSGGFYPQSGQILISTTSPSIILENTAETESGLTFQDSSAPSTQAFHINWSAQYQNLIIKSDTNIAMNIADNGNICIGSTETPNFTMCIGDDDTGFDWISDDNFVIMNNNIETMRFQENNNVRIGTTDGGGAIKFFVESTNGTAGFYRKTTTAINDIFYIYSDVGGTYNINMAIKADGYCVNTSGDYGMLSDVRLKENIVDCNSQWDDIKAIRFVNYNLINTPTQQQLGVIADELELVSNGLVKISDNSQIVNGETIENIKTVKTSIMYMKGMKALQEAINRIEILEQQVQILQNP